MLHQLVEFLNLTPLTRALVAKLYPREAIHFSSAATFLERGSAEPVSFVQRLKQIRGNIVVTENRIFFQAGTISFMTLVWLSVTGLYLSRYLQGGNTIHILIVILSLVMVLQRRPFQRDVPWESVRRVEVGVAVGLVRAEMVELKLPDRVIQFVTARSVPEELRGRWKAIRRV